MKQIIGNYQQGHFGETLMMIMCWPGCQADRQLYAWDVR